MQAIATRCEAYIIYAAIQNPPVGAWAHAVTSEFMRIACTCVHDPHISQKGS